MIDIKEWRLIAQDFKLAGAPMIIQVSQMNEILDRLEAAEKNNSAWLYANAPGGWIDNLRVKCEALQARISQVDRQEPVAWMCSDKALIQMGYKKFSDTCEGSWNIPVFAGIPGAKGEEK